MICAFFLLVPVAVWQIVAICNEAENVIGAGSGD